MPAGRPRARSGWASGAPRRPTPDPAVPELTAALGERVGDIAAGWSPTAGRYLLGLVFAWFGYHEIGQSGNYTQYVPFVAETSHAATILVSMHGFVLMVLAVAFFAGVAPRLAAAVAALLMLEIVVGLAVNGLSDTTFRDIGVLGLAVVLTGSKNHRLLLRF